MEEDENANEKSAQSNDSNRKRPCICSSRFGCEECYGYWKNKSEKRIDSWLTEVRSSETTDLFATFNPAQVGSWYDRLQTVLNTWKKLGAFLSCERRKPIADHPVCAILRGKGTVHMITDSGVTTPHMHGLFVVYRERYADSLNELCAALSSEFKRLCDTEVYAEFQKARSPDACSNYLLQVAPYSEFESLKQYARALHGKHMIRSMGLLKPPM